MGGTGGSPRQTRSNKEPKGSRGEWTRLWVAYLKANRDHSPADLLPDHELFPQHGQDEILPAAGSQALPQANNPLATVFISIVLQRERKH